VRQLLRVDIVVPDQENLVERLEAWLADRIAQGWEESVLPDGGLRFRVHLEDTPLARQFAATTAAEWPLAAVADARIEEEDWGAAWMAYFTPIEVAGTFEIVPPWLADKDTAGRRPIVIEPKMAFGTGHHASTALCLTAFAELFATGRLRPGQRFLDLGTGSGILGIGLCRLGLAGVGLDIDPQAVWCAAENVQRNTVADGMSLAVGGVGCLQGAARFDVVAANILAAPLTAMAGSLTRHLVPGGVLVLSGILTTQAADVAAAYQATGLPAPTVRESGEWASLVWQ
jgi:ribosomal protein L11 methyltransferase